MEDIILLLVTFGSLERTDSLTVSTFGKGCGGVEGTDF